MGQTISSLGNVPSKPGPPPQSAQAPNFQDATQTQTGLNLASGLTNYILSNANQTNPYGSKTISFDAQGNPTINTSLTPTGESLVKGQQATQAGVLGGTAPNVLNRMISQLSGDPGAGLPGMQYGVGGGTPGQIESNTENAAFDQIMSRLNPQMQMQTQGQNTRLANMGGVTSSPAAMRAQTNLALSQQDAVRQAAAQAIGVGQNAAVQNFGMGAQNVGLNNAGIGQQFGQNVTSQNLPLQQMMSILGMTNPTMPTFGATPLGTATGVAPANALGAAQGQAQYNIGANPLASGAFNNLLSGLGSTLGIGTGGAGAGAGGIGGLISSGGNAVMNWLRSLGPGMDSTNTLGTAANIFSNLDDVPYG